MVVVLRGRMLDWLFGKLEIICVGCWNWFFWDCWVCNVVIVVWDCCENWFSKFFEFMCVVCWDIGVIGIVVFCWFRENMGSWDIVVVCICGNDIGGGSLCEEWIWFLFICCCCSGSGRLFSVISLLFWGWEKDLGVMGDRLL